MEAIQETLASVPQSLQWAFAAVGVLVVSAKLISYLSLLVNLFVLSGTNVR